MMQQNFFEKIVKRENSFDAAENVFSTVMDKVKDGIFDVSCERIKKPY